MLAPLKVPGWTDGFEGIRHGFFTREGGHSSGIYDSLNCGFGSDDETSQVAQNRHSVSTALGVAPDQLITPYQVHSACALIATNAWERENSPQADAIITNVPGLAVGVLTADCVPILVVDPVAKVVGAAHAGWRGALGGIIEACIAKMEEAGASRDNIHACFGPCISAHSYEVGEEFKARFLDENTDYDRFFKTPDSTARPHFNLPAFVLHRLEQLDLKQVHSQAECTYQNESKFFSYRRSTHRNEPDYGRQISAIVIS